MPLRQARRDGGRVRAAGPVRGHAPREGRTQLVRCTVGQAKPVDRRFATAVAAFHQKARAKTRAQFQPGQAHRRRTADLPAGEEDARLVQVWSDESGQGKKTLAVSRDRLWREQRCAARGYHHGIDHERRLGLAGGVLAPAAIKLSHELDHCLRVQQACLDGAYRISTERKADLLAHHREFHRLNGGYPARDFRHHARHGSQAVDLVRRERFEVRLNPGAGGVVRACDGERDGRRRGHRLTIGV